MNCRLTCSAVVIGLLVAAMISLVGPARSGSRLAASPVAPDPVLKPVEEDVHEFMENLNGPGFGRLKKLLAAEPESPAQWNEVRSYALFVAELGNLLMIRPPDPDFEQEWNEHAADLREIGTQLYKATKKRSFEDTRKHYTALVRSCNACHADFSGGEPIIEP